ncbi:S1C family serine protease [Anaerobacillus isosaccharinicus]|uniref:Serine protease n=1 Tax=Anaerobacillus isosaccharinicus TaxID=1532552 RepID=A0A1S2MFW8_9BACI|nr:trypsin-like peptidase domain-containing protein [Anaerobacillus isosaccharinicus]MBA5584246.1 trypsin-like peptidase domain-containing protein [Anaerobacillus isosaccharinicus]QOY37352.1 trypsin-like peptidase domain-containing protein [Anaerobacillus isosaccharinicus]
MGYYDEHYQTESRKEKNTVKSIGVAFFSSVVGALLVIFSVPFLSNAGLLPYEVVPKGQSSVSITPDSQPASSQVGSTLNVTVNSDIIDAVERVSNAVVGVINIQESNFWSQASGEGTGSGVVYKKSNDHAYIVTNHHVIEGARQIEISLSDGSRVPAELLGTDVITDLAVLKISAKDVDTVAEFGNSELLRVGEPAIAIGNPLGLQFSRTVTQGIISATERSVPVDLNKDGRVDWEAEVLQTDAAINPGNSGGALINIHGQVIGINSMKIAGSVEGIGFSIPSAIAIPVINDLETYGEVQRPQMGVVIRSLSEIPSFHWKETFNLPDEVKTGVILERVEPMSPADRAGLEQYDVIVSLDGVAIQDTHDLRKHLYTKKKIGDELEVTFYRNGKKETTILTLIKQAL